MSRYVIGIDFGTLSARAVVADTADGHVLASAEQDYRHGVMSEFLYPSAGSPFRHEESAADTAVSSSVSAETTSPGFAPDPAAVRALRLPPDYALQDPADYLAALAAVIPEAVRSAGIDPASVEGIGIDFTASSPLPVSADGTPLCFLPRFAEEPHAYVKLWKHHGAQEEAEEMTETARRAGEPFLPYFGGRISCEYAFPKLLEIFRKVPAVYASMAHFVEAGDFIVHELTGRWTKGMGLTGFKYFYDPERGYPSDAFFAALDPALRHVVRDKIAFPVVPVGECAGHLTPEMAERLGLPPGIPVASAVCDALSGASAAGVTQPGQMLAVLGTSSCFMLLTDEAPVPVPGVFGTARDGMIPGLTCYETGQTAFGDIFGWFAGNCVPGAYEAAAAGRGLSVQQYLTELASALPPGANGLLALDWWNGNRSVLADASLSGLLVGLTLRTKPEEIYRALLEGCCFGIRVILESLSGTGGTKDRPLSRFAASGGISLRNPLLMQIASDVLRLPIHVIDSDQGSALGSAICAASAAGIYTDLREASAHMRAKDQGVHLPDPERARVYDALYKEYLTLHDHFGRGGNDVMKRLRGYR